MTSPLPGAFVLDPRLEADSLPVTDLALSTVRLMNDATYPWLLLVPKRPDLAELIDLDAADRAVLMEEIAAASKALKAITLCTKLNVGALGNIVRQLHIHVIARFDTDPAWPGPVWGTGAPRPWEPASAAETIAKLRTRLDG